MSSQEEIISTIVSKETNPFNLLKAIEQFVADGNLQNVDKIINTTHIGKINVNTELVIAAAKLGKVEFLEGVINKVPDLNLNDIGLECNSALVTAARDGHTNWVKILLLAGADVNVVGAGGYTALMAAAGNGHHECVDLLLQEKRINLNFKCYGKQKTALMKASSHDKCLDSLLNAGYDVSIKDYTGGTALDKAIADAQCSYLQALIKSGAKVNIVHNSVTPLVYSITSTEDERLTDMFIKVGANVNHIDQDGETALIKAAQRSKLDTVRLLIKSGADVNICTDDIINRNDYVNENDDASCRRNRHKCISTNTPWVYLITGIAQLTNFFL